jgi:hypothetical protein
VAAALAGLVIALIVMTVIPGLRTPLLARGHRFFPPRSWPGGCQQGHLALHHRIVRRRQGVHQRWGFRVVLAKQSIEADGHPAGIITAQRYSSRPSTYLRRTESSRHYASLS